MSDYWGNRAAWDMYEQMKDAEATADVVARVYRSASSQIVFAAQDIFEKYMTSQKYIGEKTTVSVDPDTGILIQCNPTNERLLRSIQNGKV